MFKKYKIYAIIITVLKERGGIMQQVTNLQELETAVNLNGEMVISKNNRNNMIIMSMEEYKKKLLDEELERKLLKAEKQIEEGKTVKAADVFRELEEQYEF